MSIGPLDSVEALFCSFDRQSENLYHNIMSGHSIIIKIFIFLIPLAALTLGIIYLYERKQGRKVTIKFREFSKKYKITEKDLRSVPRVLIPDNIRIGVKLSEKEYARLKGKVVDMSLSGFRVSFKAPFKAIPEDQLFRNVVVITPLKRIKVRSLKIVRIENSVKKVIFALYIKEIEEQEYLDLKNTMIYFQKFSKNGN